MDCYTGLIEDYKAEHPEATSEEVWDYVDAYRAAENTKQPGDDR
jgi:hypothetical protein